MTYSPHAQSTEATRVSSDHRSAGTNAFVGVSGDRHRASMIASLNHRLEVARAHNDQRLIGLLEREQQEILTEPVLKRLTGSLKTWWAGVQEWFAQAARLQVHEIYDEAGRLWWHGYDPNSGQEVYTDSETELLLWIEQHYQGK